MRPVPEIISLFLGSKKAFHIFFWIVVIMGLTTGEYFFYQTNFWFIFKTELINVFFYTALVYFNILYLIPNFLSKDKYLSYILLLLLSAIVVTPIKIMTLHWWYNGNPAQQEYLRSNQIFYFLSSYGVVAASTVVKITRDWLKGQQERKELETQTMQSELKFLRSQINPHFLFNTLNSLYALTLRKSDKAPDIVLKLSEMMRYMLYECNEKRVPLSKEVNYLRNYLDLEFLRHGEGIEITFDVNGQINNQLIAPLLFIPFVENSFKHGLKNSLTKGYVKINLQVSDTMLNMTISNSKPDTAPAPDMRRSGGIGLVNVKRRLELLYPKRYDLRIDSEPHVYNVSLDIDMME